MHCSLLNDKKREVVSVGLNSVEMLDSCKEDLFQVRRSH